MGPTELYVAICYSDIPDHSIILTIAEILIRCSYVYPLLTKMAQKKPKFDLFERSWQRGRINFVDPVLGELQTKPFFHRAFLIDLV